MPKSSARISGSVFSEKATVRVLNNRVTKSFEKSDPFSVVDYSLRCPCSQQPNVDAGIWAASIIAAFVEST